MRVVSMASARLIAGRMVVRRRAILDCPARDGPRSRTLCSPHRHPLQVHSRIEPVSRLSLVTCFQIGGKPRGYAYDNASRNAWASCRSVMSKPAVHQPSIGASQGTDGRQHRTRAGCCTAQRDAVRFQSEAPRASAAVLTNVPVRESLS
jgi:hypothetical protein